MKVVSVVGARPQFVKAGIVSRKLRDKGVKEILVHTGQHYDFNMSNVFFRELRIPNPDYYLGIGSGMHGEQTGKMLIEMEKVLVEEKPDIALVYGDTNSTLAGALAASKLHIPVAHVEAGLRSYNRKMPEEINRVLTDHISEILFAPTDVAVENLKKEGITKGVYKVGDVMFDVALEVAGKVNEKKVLNKYGLKPEKFILVTIHRAENTVEETFLQIWKALNKLAKLGIKLFFPVHPRTKKLIEKLELVPESKNLTLTEPVSYFEMVALEKNAKVIITDSGGVQKEGFFFGTPCVIPREETEWIELVDFGFNHLAGVNTEKIFELCEGLFFGGIEIQKNLPKFYGDGSASDKIVSIISGDDFE
ncbi:UDP-N-acetylglucosamine 2-epimerase (non-hydrolysing)/UDP-GlcNAc3NAcA epimerase [Desulfurobacterium pacificum]|uniref:UDP-N-acetylglucosamine 2-epimerase (Non-hydrolysing)/UDP-GlcNAc3NAcA epimerase n=1 Tax=Desulfurobacterium pacificum TaxID=240166 RepID=A0ABY1NN21_9BACT|nr:UDP-N-acetylglucosamine 2-epimerase (non-hydrolyzing) [Desulfurobacterium pacificum]SMP14002.1 UDP-N-acetylglucosamine 2-epimerase (non-hydrolysing)/UDP-GlcNAc3NAcA epimerase [Desulfurobacterium pacificum]